MARFGILGLLGMALLVLSFCLLWPLANRAMSWEEAGLGIIPAAGLALVASVLFLRGTAIPKTSLTPASRRSRALVYWSVALAWSLLVGALVTVVTTGNYDNNMRRVQEDRRRGDRFSLYEAYARYNQIGKRYGWSLLGLAGVSVVGLGVSIRMKRNSE